MLEFKKSPLWSVIAFIVPSDATFSSGKSNPSIEGIEGFGRFSMRLESFLDCLLEWKVKKSSILKLSVFSILISNEEMSMFEIPKLKLDESFGGFGLANS